MNDYLVKALAYDGNIRAYAVRTTEMVSEAQRRHQTWRTASAALGRTLTAGVIIGAMQKGEAQLTIKIDGGGPIGVILVDSNSKGEARGYVSNPQVDFEANQYGKLDVRRAVGTDGTLSIVKDLGMRDFFSGQVPIVSGEIGEDFTYYFATSEQVPSSVGVGVLVNPDDTILAAGGFIFQLMPGTPDALITKMEERLKTIEPISRLIEKGLTPEEILYELFGNEEVKVLETMPVEFRCTCSKERFRDAIIGLGAAEINAMIEEDGKAEAHCHFCNERYPFSKEELEDMLQEAK